MLGKKTVELSFGRNLTPCVLVLPPEARVPPTAHRHRGAGQRGWARSRSPSPQLGARRGALVCCECCGEVRKITGTLSSCFRKSLHVWEASRAQLQRGSRWFRDMA